MCACLVGALSQVRFALLTYLCLFGAPAYQVLPDFKGQVWSFSMEQALGDEQQAELARCKSWFNSGVRRFLDHEGLEKGDIPAKLHRRPTYSYLLSLDHILKLLTGQGLERFAKPLAAPDAVTMQQAMPGALQGNLGTKPLALEQTPVLSVAMDQCSVGVSAASFCNFHLGLRVEPIYDPAHRTWNSERAGLISAGFFEMVLLFTLPYNLNYGPWLGSAWWRHIQGAAREYKSQAGAIDDPLFRRFLPKIAADRMEGDMVTDPLWVQERWADLGRTRATESKGPKMALCRWYSFQDCFRYWDPHHHTRLLCMLYWAISSDLLTEESESRSLALKPLKIISEAEKVTMREARMKTTSLHAQGKNQLHVATLVLLNGNLQRQGRLAYTMMTHMRRHHSHQTESMRSPAACWKWYAEMACGSALEPLLGTFRALADPAELQYMFFALSPAELPLASGAELGGPLTEDENRWATDALLLACHLTWHRLRHLMWHLEGYPGQMAFCLSADPGHVAQGLDIMRQTKVVWDAAQESGIPRAKKSAAKNYMNKEVVKLAFSWVGASGYTMVPSALQEVCKTLFRAGGTKVVEDCFQRMRVKESRGQISLAVSPGSAWFSIIQQQVLGKVHSFKEVQYNRCSYQRYLQELPRKVPANVFHPRSHVAKLPLKDVVGDKLQANWPSFSAVSYTAVWADMACWREAVEKPQLWDQLDRCWLCIIFEVGTIVRERGTAQFFLVLGSLQRTACLAWCLEHVEMHGTEFWRPRLSPASSLRDVPYKWLICVDLDTWECQPVKWVSPLHIALLASAAGIGNASSSGCHLKGIWAQKDGECMGLLQASALRGFKALSPQQVLEFIKHLQVKVAASATTMQMVEALVSHAFPSLDEGGMLEALGQRQQQPLMEDGFWKTQEVQDMFDDSDMGIISKFTDVSVAKQSYDQEYTSKKKAYLRKSVPAQAAPARKKRRKASDTAAASSGSGPSTRVPANLVSEEEAAAFLPPGAPFKVWKDSRGNRWQCRHPLHNTISRTWTLYGERASLAMVLKWAWEWHRAAGHEDVCPDWIWAAEWRHVTH
jgi:hypothetical protein